MDLVGVPANQLTDFIWRLVEGYIDEALHVVGDLETLSAVRDWLEQRVLQLWVLTEDGTVIGALTTEIVVYPNATACRIRHMGGRLNSEVIKTISSVVIPWAKAQGCCKVEVWGRPGWEKVGQKVLPNVKRTTVVMHGDIE
jgi:hypothetical protein